MWANVKWSESEFVTREYPIGHMLFHGKNITLFNINLFRQALRTFFVVMMTMVTLTLPFFTNILGLMGSISYWPIVVYFPVEMHIAQNKIGKRTMKWIGLQLLSLICFLLSLAAASSAIHGLYKNMHTCNPFTAKEWFDLRKEIPQTLAYYIYLWGQLI